MLYRLFLQFSLEEGVTVFTLFFCMVEGNIGITDDLLGILVPLLGEGNPYTGSRLNPDSIEGYRFFHGLQNTLGYFDGLGGFGYFIHQDHELITPEPSYGVHVPHAFLQTSRGCFENKIAHNMTVGVVYQFALVQVDKEYRKG